MNLRVDLILQSEQRSANLFTPRVALRIAIFLVPAVAALAVGMVVLKVMRMGEQSDMLERQWLQAEPRQNEAIKLAGQLNANKKIREEIEGWRKSQIQWHGQLAALPRMTPRTVQLLELNVDQVLEILEKEKALARSFTMQIRGRSFGKGSDRAVDELEQNLRTFSEFAPLVENVEVVSFAADATKGASEDDRVFDIRCKYLPRTF